MKPGWKISIEDIARVTNVSDPDAGALVLWARWTVDGLFYLEELDDRAMGTSKEQMGFHPDVIDMSHARWACASAVTSLDE